MPTVHNHLELKYLIRAGIDKLSQMKSFNKFCKAEFDGNRIIVILPKKVKDEYIRTIVDEIMEDEFSAVPAEDDNMLGYQLIIADASYQNAELFETIVTLILPEYIHSYLNKNNGEWV